VLLAMLRTCHYLLSRWMLVPKSRAGSFGGDNIACSCRETVKNSSVVQPVARLSCQRGGSAHETARVNKT